VRLKRGWALERGKAYELLEMGQSIFNMGPEWSEVRTLQRWSHIK
jgi:hypothetical protein